MSENEGVLGEEKLPGEGGVGWGGEEKFVVVFKEVILSHRLLINVYER